MGQSDVREVLKKGHWLFVAEIMRYGEMSRPIVNRALKKLLKTKEVESREVIVRKGRATQWRISQENRSTINTKDTKRE